MAKGVNKTILVGNIGQEPELRYTKSGIAVTTIRVATPTVRKVGDEYEEDVTWHSVVLWRHLAEIVAEYASKGDQIYIEGQIRYRDYEGKDGTQYKNTAEIHADEMVLGSRASRNDDAGRRRAAVDTAESSEPDDDLPF